MTNKELGNAIRKELKAEGITSKDVSVRVRDSLYDRENMKKYRIKAASKKHFDSLIKDYRKDGFMIITYGYFLAELEKGDEFIIIEF